MPWNPSRYLGSNYYPSSRPAGDEFLPDINGNPDNWSDVQAQAYWDMVLMQQQYARDEQWYNDYESYAAKYNQLRAQGVSSRGAWQHILSQGVNADSNASPAVSGTQQNSDAVADAQAMLGAANVANESIAIAQQNEALQSQVRVNDATAANQISEAQNNSAYNPFIAPTAQADIGKTVADTQNATADTGLKVSQKAWTEQDIDRIKKDMDLTDEEIKLRQQENYWYGPMKQAEIRVYASQVQQNLANAEQAWTQAAVNRNEINVQAALIGVYNSQELATNQDARVNAAKADLITEQVNTQKEITTNQQMENQKLAADIAPLIIGDLPYSFGDQARIRKFLEEGNFEGARRAASVPWMFAMYEANGNTVGQDIGAPEPINSNGSSYGISFSNNLIRSFGHGLRSISPLLPFSMPNPTYNNNYYYYTPYRRKNSPAN